MEFADKDVGQSSNPSGFHIRRRTPAGEEAPIIRVVRGKVSTIQACNWASCDALRNEEPQFEPRQVFNARRSERIAPFRDGVIAEQKGLGTFWQLQPLSSSKIALARGAT